MLLCDKSLPKSMALCLSGAHVRVSCALLPQELAAPVMDDQPLYVNAKQYHRILKRRQQRAKLESQGKLPKTRQVLNKASSDAVVSVFVNGTDMKFVVYLLSFFATQRLITAWLMAVAEVFVRESTLARPEPTAG